MAVFVVRTDDHWTEIGRSDRPDGSKQSGARRQKRLERPAVTTSIPQMCNGGFTLSCLRTFMNGNVFVEGEPLFNL
jgi:hypothetical protein